MRQRARADNLTICYRKKDIDVSFSCVRPVIDHEFCHNIVKVLRVHLVSASWIHSYFDNVKVKIDHRSKFSNLSNWKEEA